MPARRTVLYTGVLEVQAGDLTPPPSLVADDASASVDEDQPARVLTRCEV